MDLFITILTSIINIVLGLFTYFKNPKSTTNRLFAFLTLQISIWSIVNYLSLHQSTEALTLFWIRMDMLPGAPMGPTIYLLVKTFPNNKIAVSKRSLIAIILLVLITMFFAISPYMFTAAIFEDGNIRAVPGPAIALFGLNFLGSLILAFLTLIKRYKRSSGLERLQLKYLLFGLIASFSLVAITQFLFVVFLKTSFFIILGPVYSLILVGSISYAIVRHKLFNIKVITTQIFTTVLWVVLFTRLFTSQGSSEFITNLFIFLIMLVIGVLLIRSVKKEVEQREKLEQLTQKLKHLDEQKDEFISMAAHELRAPMTAIKGYISMIMEGDAGDIPEKARGYLADANNINDRLVRLVNNMLNVSRIEEGRMAYQIEDEYLSRVVRLVYSQFVPEAERKGLAYKLEIPTHIKDKVRVDPDRIQEVIGNLISNAVKYTENGFIKVRLTQPSKGSVRFEVEDTGLGVSEEEQKKLFQKFERIETNLGKTTGTGLGLYISKLLIETFHGKIDINSKPGKGSIFWFELPLL